MKSNSETANLKNESDEKLNIYEWCRLILVHISVSFFLFICAKDITWWQAWIVSGLLVLAGVGGRFLADIRHPGILAERNKYFMGSEVKQWDKVLSPLMGVSFTWPIFIIAGLDHHFGWSSNFSVWINIIGIIITGTGYLLAVWALVENRFFSSMVRIQQERGHVVCTTGPYQFIRHPGYAGLTAMFCAPPLVPSSLWSFIPVGISLCFLIVRTALEDRTLMKELEGYRLYSEQVRYRLLPGIW